MGYRIFCFFILSIASAPWAQSTFANEDPCEGAETCAITQSFFVENETELSELGAELLKIYPTVGSAPADGSAEVVEPVLQVVDIDGPASSKLSLTLTRVFVSGAATAWSLTLKGSPEIWQTLAVVAPLASFSGLVQWNATQVGAYFDAPKTLVAKFFRWWSVELAFLATAQGASTWVGLGNPITPESMANLLGAASVATVTQGIWDLAIAKERGLQERVVGLQKKLDFKLFVVSFASIVLNLANLNQVPLAIEALAVMGVAGGVDALRVKARIEAHRKCETRLAFKSK
jgi:hypothetical protein